MNRKGFAPLVIIGIITLIAIAGVGIWSFIKQKDSATNSSAPLDTSKWRTYTNQQYSTSLKYPSAWTYIVQPYDSSTIGIAFFSPGKKWGDLGIISVNIMPTSQCQCSGVFGKNSVSTTIGMIGSYKNFEQFMINGMPATKIFGLSGLFEFNIIFVQKSENVISLEIDEAHDTDGVLDAMAASIQ